MKRTIPILMLILLLGAGSVLPYAWADGHDGRHDSGWSHDRHGDHDGHWEMGWHDGHLGWLWVVGGAVLLYNATHPAPVPQPPVVIMQPSAPPVNAQAYWYFCRSSGSYYPYVQSCPEGWQVVSAVPPPPNQ